LRINVDAASVVLRFISDGTRVLLYRLVLRPYDQQSL
jgi:hypothetical protein